MLSFNLDAIFFIDFIAKVEFSVKSPPRKLFGFKIPHTNAASVTVGSEPPLLYEAGPGFAPELLGPTCNNPPSSTEAILPPPAPILLTSTDGKPVIWPLYFWPIQVSFVLGIFLSLIKLISNVVPPKSVTIAC